MIPGVSRAGITMTAARFLNFNRVDSGKISFLLSIPALAGASFLGLKDAFNEPIEQIVILMAAEDGSMKAFVKEPKDYEEELQKAIQTFYDTVNPQLQEVK